ncbi:hypothetical protein BML2537_12840 [Providencia stuartii]|uniref:hypothetical protein n=1 Tax=Providencia stuartii TaxID=588 RepID=UPI001373948C|nr:hypothetical protein [Providencia stuartii]MBN5560262.1 hypothetical protein [Providencia stuartii]BBV07790.1 hypothetical protein BML2537_12840 [Providencia stuartii]
MEFKHSPAPWRCHDKRPNCSGYSIVGNDGQYIGFVGDSDELSPMGANAHLIAAAPELLEQLIRLRNKIASYKPDDDDDLDIVDAVIAKALGQQ